MTIRRSLRMGLVGSMLFLVAGDAGRAYREGKDLDEAGSDYKAAVKYLEALRADSGHKKALEAVRLVSRAAYDEHLEEAASAEAAKSFPDSLVLYKDLVVLVKGLKEFEAAKFEVVDLAAKVTEMTASSAEAAYQRASTAFAARNWEQAVGACGEAVGFIQGYKDCSEKVQTAYYKWGEADVAGKKYRSAVAHYTGSFKAGSTGDAQARAAAIQLALAQYFVEKGACRQGVADATASGKLLSSPDADTTLAAARACAITPIAMAAVENPTGVNPAGMAVGDLLADAILSATRASASEYLTIIERSSLDSLLQEQGIANLSSGAVPKGVKGVRYLVLGKITQLKVVTVPATAKTANATASQSYDCTRTKNDGTVVAARCNRDVQVVVDQYSGSSTVSLSMSVKVVDVQTGTQLALETVDATRADQVLYAMNLRFPNGSPVGLSRDGSDGTVTSQELGRLLEAKQTMASEDELMKAALDEVSKESAAVILRQVDHPATVPDPTTLSIP